MPVDTQRPFRPTLTLQRPPSPPFPLQALPPPSPPLRASPPQLDLKSSSSRYEADGPPITLFVQPASPALSSSGSFEAPEAERLPPEIPPTSFIPPPSPRGFGGSLASRRRLNKKSLSLLVPAAPSPSSLLSPTSPSFLRPGGALSDVDTETRSLPPSPVSLQAFIGVEGAEPDDRTIGRLMMKQQADEMREQMKGGRGMKRRTSIPSLNLAPTPAVVTARPAPPRVASTNGGSAVQMLSRNSAERSHEAVESDEVAEEFPYALGPREIIPGIFLGSEQNARDPALLREWGFAYVLNVAKEVECPWIEDAAEVEGIGMDHSAPSGSTADSPTVSFAPSASPTKTTFRARPKQRRTKTQTTSAPPEPETARPLFVRPTASTPNLQALFGPSTAPPPPPALPPLPPNIDALEHAAKARSFSSSPPQRRSPPRARKSLQQVDLAAESPSTRGDGSIRYPANPRTGRPALEYLWLMWGHDESDLVEAGKFQTAFDFLDQARTSDDGKGRVLVHCQCGVSRSATVVIAYCMREAAKALEEDREVAELASCTGMHDTYSFVKERSEWVGPNLGLVFQLVAYERTLRGSDPLTDDGTVYPDYPPEEDSQLSVTVDYSHPGYSTGLAQSPRTPVSSHGSSASDSHLSTPEVHAPSPLSSVDKAARKSSLSIVIGQPRPPATVAMHGDDESGLSPLGVPAAHETDRRSTSFVLPIPPSRSSRYPTLSPLQHVITPRETPSREEIVSPVGLLHGPASPSQSLVNPLDRLTITGSPSQPAPAAVLPSSTRAADPLALVRGRPTLRLTSPTSVAEGQVSGPPSPKTVFGGSQSPSERRASHRRVFSDTMSLPAFLGRSSSAGALSSLAGEAARK